MTTPTPTDDREVVRHTPGYRVTAVNHHQALVDALRECMTRFRRCIISNGTDEEYADAAIAAYRTLLSQIGEA